MGAIKVFLKEVVLPIALAFCLASFLKPIYMPDGVCDYFLMWICVGLPFGIRRMCLWLVPSGYGIYFKLNTALPPFIPLPRFMLAGEYSINAKLLYGLLLNRTTLSQKSGWVSEDGNVYVIYTIRQMADDLDRSERTVKTALRELENAGLITRVRQGWNQANRIFLQIPDRVQVSSRPEGNICPMDVQDSSPCMGQKLPASNTDTEYKEQSKTERVESMRRRYGEFQNVFLTGEECSLLETAYPGKAAEYIERLSRYMASNDRHYANHYATIKKWLDEDSKGRGAKNYTYDDNEGECL